MKQLTVQELKSVSGGAESWNYRAGLAMMRAGVALKSPTMTRAGILLAGGWNWGKKTP